MSDDIKELMNFLMCDNRIVVIIIKVPLKVLYVEVFF